MSVWSSTINPASESYQANREAMLRCLEQVRELEQRTVERSSKSAPLFRSRKQLLPRERLSLLLDAGSPFLELSALAGYGLDHADPKHSIPGGGAISGIGFICGVRCLVVVSDAGVEAGSVRPMGLEKMLRAQQIALECRLPFIHLVESAGANLLRYKVNTFVLGGGIFRNLARLSAAGIPVITVVHGSSTAGGAYMPGLSDYVVMVRGRARAFLAGPPLLKAATGEVATEEELGGGSMHATVSGSAEYLAEDDRDGIRLARDIITHLNWQRSRSMLSPRGKGAGLPPRYSAEELLGIMPVDGKKPVDMREIIIRLADDSVFMEFKPLFGAGTVCGHLDIGAWHVGVITNNAPIDPAGAQKATHFIQSCCQTNVPLLYLQNTTGYMVGKAYEQAGMIKHGSKMIQAVSNATVPQLTVQCGASFGAGNYGMCGRAYQPRFLFSWPNARTAVMGGEQAALTMRIVATEGARRKGIPVDEEALSHQDRAIVHTFDSQQSVLTTSAMLLDDGVIDPRNTRAVLQLALETCALAGQQVLHPIQFGVARP